MDVKDLKYFVAVYEAKGFSHACRRLGTVQSNVSIRIRNLEKFLRVPLFERRYRRIVPTEEAEILYGQAKHVLALLGEAQDRMRLSRAESVLRTSMSADALADGLALTERSA